MATAATRAGNVVVVVSGRGAATVVVGAATVVVGAATVVGAAGATAEGMTRRSPTGTRFGLRMPFAAASALTVTLYLRATAARLSPRLST